MIYKGYVALVSDNNYRCNSLPGIATRGDSNRIFTNRNQAATSESGFAVSINIHCKHWLVNAKSP